MNYPTIEAGHSYRLRRNWEIRDEKTGTMKQFFLKETVLKVTRASAEEDRAWVEGCKYPFPIEALRRAVDPA